MSSFLFVWLIMFTIFTLFGSMPNQGHLTGELLLWTVPTSLIATLILFVLSREKPK